MLIEFVNCVACELLKGPWIIVIIHTSYRHCFLTNMKNYSNILRVTFIINSIKFFSVCEINVVLRFFFYFYFLTNIDLNIDKLKLILTKKL